MSAIETLIAQVSLCQIGQWDIPADCKAARAEIAALRLDAAVAAVVWKFIDRMNDVCEQDTADRIVSEFVAAVMPAIDAAIATSRKGRDEQAHRSVSVVLACWLEAYCGAGRRKVWRFNN